MKEYKHPPSVSVKDMKLIYHRLLDGSNTFQALYKELEFEQRFPVYSALKQLAALGLIYQHPIFLGKQPTSKDLKKAASLNLEVKDTSMRALAWSLLDYKYLRELPESEEECEELIRKFAARNKPYIRFWHKFRFYSDA